MKVLFISFFILMATYAGAQTSDQYRQLVSQADSAFTGGDFKTAHDLYERAFAVNNDMARVIDRYNAACTWALDNNRDKAFYHLNRVVNKGKFKDKNGIINDKDLYSLHSDPRWDQMILQIEQNIKNSD